MSYACLHQGFGWRVLALGVCCLVAGATLGCAASTATPEPAEITFSWLRGEAADYEALLRRFEESHPHITIDLWEPGAGVSDVFVALPYGLAGQIERGEILSLDAFIEQDPSFAPNVFYSGTAELFTNEGKTWAIPAGADTMVMYYNQDLFDKYGVPYPQIGWTWEDFLIAGLSITDSETGVFGYAAVDTYRSLDPLLFIYQHGGRIVDDLQNPTRTTYDDPLTVEAVEWYVDLMNHHNIAPTVEQTRRIFGPGRESIRTAILLDSIGMWVGWFYERGGES